MFEIPKMKTFKEFMMEESDPKSRAMRSSKSASHIYFLFVTFTVPYVLITEVMPKEFSESTASTRYWTKIFMIFVAMQAFVNWLCCQVVSTHLKGTRDRAVVEKTLWENEIPDDITEHSNFCKKCRLVAPYRSKTHHCKQCDRCILRRDHHCFLVGTCIGYYNQRYFAIFTFYTALGSAIAFYFLRRHLAGLVSEREDFSWTEYILPLTIKHAIFGRIAWVELAMVFYCYTFIWTTLMGCGFFFVQMTIISMGLTLHEFKAEKRARGLSVSDNFREVFGPCWLLNFLLPMQLVFKQKEFDQPLLLSEYDTPLQNGGHHLSDSFV